MTGQNGGHGPSGRSREDDSQLELWGEGGRFGLSAGSDPAGGTSRTACWMGSVTVMPTEYDSHLPAGRAGRRGGRRVVIEGQGKGNAP